jgi:hypothetical protein
MARYFTSGFRGSGFAGPRRRPLEGGLHGVSLDGGVHIFLLNGKLDCAPATAVLCTSPEGLAASIWCSEIQPCSKLMALPAR